MGRKTKKNILFTDAVWARVNSDNKDLLEEFLEYLRSTDHSPNTIFQYESDLRQFFCYDYSMMGNKHITELTKRDYLKWQNMAINEWEWSPNRLARVRSVISSLENYIECFCDDVWPDFRPLIRKIPAPVKQEVRDKTVLTSEEVETFLQDMLNRGEVERAVLFALATYSGRRKSELPRFKMSDFDDDCVVAGALYKTRNKIKSKGRGKNGKLIYCYVLKHQFDKYLNVWREYRKEHGIESEWLLPDPDKSDEQLKLTTIDSWSRVLSKRTGRDIYPHSFRHFFTTYLVSSGIPANIIKDIVSWESLEMVDRYTDLDVEDELDKYFCEDGIKQQSSKGIGDL